MKRSDEADCQLDNRRLLRRVPQLSITNYVTDPGRSRRHSRLSPNWTIPILNGQLALYLVYHFVRFRRQCSKALNHFGHWNDWAAHRPFSSATLEDRLGGFCRHKSLKSAFQWWIVRFGSPKLTWSGWSDRKFENKKIAPLSSDWLNITIQLSNFANCGMISGAFTFESDSAFDSPFSFYVQLSVFSFANSRSFCLADCSLNWFGARRIVQVVIDTAAGWMFDSQFLISKLSIRASWTWVSLGLAIA